MLDREQKLRQAALFGYFRGAVNATDGRYTYHRYPPDLRSQEIYQYTVMPTHEHVRFTPQELAGATLAPPFSFTKGVPTLRIPLIAASPMNSDYGPAMILEDTTRLYDLAIDPGQEHPIQDPDREALMVALMRELMIANDTPPEQLDRLGLVGLTDNGR